MGRKNNKKGCTERNRRGNDTHDDTNEKKEIMAGHILGRECLGDEFWRGKNKNKIRKRRKKNKNTE